MKKIFIIAGDTSGDLHASKLMLELKKFDSDIEFFGIGGENMINQGLSSIVSLNEISVVGFWEVAKKYTFFTKLIKLVKNEILKNKIDLFIAVDYPGFNQRIATFVKGLGIPVVWYIAPQLWAWGAKRAKKFAQIIDELLVVFPFEKEFFENFGLKTHFVGHPLLDIHEFCQESVNSNRKNQILFMPGSRIQELKKHLPIILNVNKIIKENLTDFQSVISVPPTLSKSIIQDANKLANIEVSLDSKKSMLESKAGIIKSGTSNLEACLGNLPFLMFYKTSRITYFLAKKLVDLEFLSLVNILAKKNVVAELIQKDASPQKIFIELEKVLFDENYRSKMLDDFRSIKKYLGSVGASVRAAEIIFKKLRNEI